MNALLNRCTVMLAGALLIHFAGVPAVAGDNQPEAAATDANTPLPPEAPVPPTPPQPPDPPFQFDYHPRPPAETIWLGVGAEETSEALTAQLGLKPGEGLVVTLVASNSPAAMAGLQRNDVLSELDGQMLVDGAQLRKLVQMHADGDSVKIEFYRAGRKQSASAKLIKHKPEENFGIEEAGKNFDNFLFRFNDQHAFALDNKKLNLEIQKSMKEAQQALQEAVRQSMDATDGLDHKLEIIHRKLGNLADGGVNLSKSTTVTVKNEGEAVRTIVKKDATGTYVIVADPAKHLTAHDPDGKLLFDGTIDSPEQQQKVPRELWEKVEPMLGQLDHDSADKHNHDSPNDSESK